jgi:hypothetical protein
MRGRTVILEHSYPADRDFFSVNIDTKANKGKQTKMDSFLPSPLLAAHHADNELVVSATSKFFQS